MVLAVTLVGGCSASKPAGIDLNPLTSLKLQAGPDFLARVKAELAGQATDWSKQGVGYLVFLAPHPDPSSDIFRSINLFREETTAAAELIYLSHRKQFTDPRMDWELYSETGEAQNRALIAYKGFRFDTNHGIPTGVNTKPEIFIGVLKQNVFVVISYSANRPAPDYIKVINGDVEYVGGLLRKAGRG